MITQAQRRLVSHLIHLIANDHLESDRRWGANADLATRYASENEQLLLARDWTADLVLSANGDVLVIDTESGEPARPANESEQRGALYRSIAELPELLSLLPARPSDAMRKSWGRTLLGCWLSTGSYLCKPRRFIGFGVVMKQRRPGPNLASSGIEPPHPAERGEHRRRIPIGRFQDLLPRPVENLFVVRVVPPHQLSIIANSRCRSFS